MELDRVPLRVPVASDDDVNVSDWVEDSLILNDAVSEVVDDCRSDSDSVMEPVRESVSERISESDMDADTLFVWEIGASERE